MFFQDLEPAFLISEKIKSCIAQTLFIYVHIKRVLHPEMLAALIITLP